MSPAPRAPCGAQHCPVVAVLHAPRSYPLPDPKEVGWVGGRKNARAAAAARVLRDSGRLRVLAEQELGGVRRGGCSNRCARVHVNPALASRLAAPVSAAVPLWSLRRLCDHQGPLAPQMVSRLVSWCN